MIYHNPQAVVQVNRRRSRAFAIERSVRQSCSLSPLLYVLALEPLLRRLSDEGANLALRSIPFASPLTARVYAFSNDITVFVSRHLDIEAVKKAVAEYERIAELAVLPLPRALPLSRLLLGGRRPMVCRQVCIQRTCNGGLGMPDLGSHWLAERLAYFG